MQQADYTHEQSTNQAGRASWMEILKEIRIREIISYMPGAVCVVLITLSQCFTLPSLFAVSAMVAFTAEEGRCPKGARLGMGMSLLLQALWGIRMEWLQGIVFFAIPMLIRRPVRKRRITYTIASVLLFICALQGVFQADLMEAIRRMAGALVALGLTPAMQQCANIYGQRKKEIAQDDLMCIALCGIVLLCGGARIEIIGVNVGAGAAAVLVIMAAWMCGIQAGAVAGIISGFAMMAAGQHVLYMVVMPLAGLLAGCFMRKNRLLSVCSFMFSSICLIFLTLNSLPHGIWWNLAAGAVVFTLLPEKKLRPVIGYIRRLQWMKPKDNAYLRMRMRRWIRAMNGLMDALPQARMPVKDILLDSEAVAEKLCEQCDLLPICWRDQYEKTKRCMEAVVAEDEVNLDVINRSFSYCSRIAHIPPILEGIMEKRRQEVQRAWMANYEKNILETHLTAIGQAAQLISMEGMQTSDEEGEWLQRAEEALQKMHFSGKVAFAKCIDGHMQVCIQYDMVTLHPMMLEKLARQLGVYLGVRLKVAEQNAVSVVLQEEAEYKLRIGKATACAMPADGQPMTENGDAALIRFLPGDQVLVAVSDGMGHGAEAKEESGKTLQMLFGCLETGYSRDQAMKAVNGAMLNATGSEIFATVDMCVIDLWSGETWMNKLGASGSVIIQGQHLRWITGAALPLGIMEHVLPAEKQLYLSEGDRVILLTDGIADQFGREEEILHTVHRYLEEAPQEMADRLLEEALLRAGSMPPDDMTVLCVELVSACPENKKRAGLA